MKVSNSSIGPNYYTIIDILPIYRCYINKSQIRDDVYSLFLDEEQKITKSRNFIIRANIDKWMVPLNSKYLNYIY